MLTTEGTALAPWRAAYCVVEGLKRRRLQLFLFQKLDDNSLSCLLTETRAFCAIVTAADRSPDDDVTHADDDDDDEMGDASCTNLSTRTSFDPTAVGEYPLVMLKLHEAIAITHLRPNPKHDPQSGS